MYRYYQIDFLHFDMCKSKTSHLRIMMKSVRLWFDGFISQLKCFLSSQTLSFEIHFEKGIDRFFNLGPFYCTQNSKNENYLNADKQVSFWKMQVSFINFCTSIFLITSESNIVFRYKNDRLYQDVDKMSFCLFTNCVIYLTYLQLCLKEKS